MMRKRKRKMMGGLTKPQIAGGVVAGGVIAGGAVIAGGIILASPIFQMNTPQPTQPPTILLTPAPTIIKVPDFDPRNTVRTAAATAFAINDDDIPTAEEEDGALDQLKLFFTDVFEAPTENTRDKRGTNMIAREFPGFEKLQLYKTAVSNAPRGDFLTTTIEYIVDVKFAEGSNLDVKDEIDAELEGASSIDFVTNYIPNALPEGTVFARTIAIATTSGLSFPTSAPSDVPTITPTDPPTTSPSQLPSTVPSIIPPSLVSASPSSSNAPSSIPSGVATISTSPSGSAAPSTINVPVKTRARLTFILQASFIGFRTPSQAEYDGIMEQVGLFYTEVLGDVFDNFQSFEAIAAFKDSNAIGSDTLRVVIDYDGSTTFVPGTDAPTMMQVEQALEGADIDIFRLNFIPNTEPDNSIFKSTTSVGSSTGTLAPTASPSISNAPSIMPTEPDSESPSGSNAPSTLNVPVKTRARLTFILQASFIGFRTPSQAEYDGIMEQVGLFYTEVLGDVFDNFQSFEAIAAFKDSNAIGSDTLRVVIDYDGSTTFVPGTDAPTMMQVEQALEGADIDIFRLNFIPNTEPDNSIFKSTTSVGSSTGTLAPTASPSISNAPSIMPTASITPSNLPSTGVEATEVAPISEAITNRATLTFVKVGTNKQPSEAEIDGIMEQINIFYSDVLRTAFPTFESFAASMVGTNSELTRDMVVTRIAYDGVTRFGVGTGAYPIATVEAVIETANLNAFRENYIPNASPVGASIFTTTEAVFTSSGTDAPTAAPVAAESIADLVDTSGTLSRGSSDMQPRQNIFRHATTATSVDSGPARRGTE